MNFHGQSTHSMTTNVPPMPASNDKDKNYLSRFLDSNFEGFIHHPGDFPLQWRKLSEKKIRDKLLNSPDGQIGLCFTSEKYIKPGTYLELNIELRGEEQKFIGQVVLVKNLGDKFETGVWFTSRAIGSRVRIVEQICHIESYLRHKRHYEGPFMSQERVAQEWVSRFAAYFPSFS